MTLRKAPIGKTMSIYYCSTQSSKKFTAFSLPHFSLINKAIILLFAFLAFGIFHLRADDSHEKPIVIIIPSYNNKNWCHRNLDSILNQKYEHFRAIYLDDASTDGTGDLVREYLKENDPEHIVTLIRNDENVGPVGNIYRGVWMCHPFEIVVIVDGDDWLSHEYVLQTVNEVYSDPDVWMTYGQFIEYPSGNRGGAAQVPKEIIQKNLFREYDWCTTHLRTFYAGLFQKIKKDDLLYEGKFFPVTGDLASTFPMLEMAGFHSRFIPEILYVYNVATQLNERKLYLEKQIYIETVIRAKKRYAPIEKPY